MSDNFAIRRKVDWKRSPHVNVAVGGDTASHVEVVLYAGNKDCSATLVAMLARTIRMLRQILPLSTLSNPFIEKDHLLSTAYQQALTYETNRAPGTKLSTSPSAPGVRPLIAQATPSPGSVTRLQTTTPTGLEITLADKMAQLSKLALADREQKAKILVQMENLVSTRKDHRSGLPLIGVYNKVRDYVERKGAAPHWSNEIKSCNHIQSIAGHPMDKESLNSIRFMLWVWSV
jgi:hypothetical protein